MDVAAPSAPHSPPVFLSYGFRPFFLAAGAWSAAALAIWLASFTGHLTLPTRFGALGWHMHEMLFGFVMAAIAGFLLTAIPNWTGRRPVQGAYLGALALLWLAGRCVCIFSSWLPGWLSIFIDLLFPAALAATVAYEIVSARNWRNVPIIAPVVLLGVANLLTHLEANGAWPLAGIGWRLGLGAIIVLLSVIGGRIVPNFTRNWLRANRSAELPAPRRWVEALALGSLHTGIIGWAVFPTSMVPGVVLVLAAAINLLRLWRWHGVFTTAEPLLFVLHIGYAWLVVGAALLGLSVLTQNVSQDAGIHAFTAGAIGTMILAVMTRAARGHTGRLLKADRGTTALYVLVTGSALTRVTAAFIGQHAVLAFTLSGVLWLAAFGGFVVVYGPILAGPRIGPRA